MTSECKPRDGRLVKPVPEPLCAPEKVPAVMVCPVAVTAPPNVKVPFKVRFALVLAPRPVTVSNVSASLAVAMLCAVHPVLLL